MAGANGEGKLSKHRIIDGNICLFFSFFLQLLNLGTAITCQGSFKEELVVAVVIAHKEE